MFLYVEIRLNRAVSGFLVPSPMFARNLSHILNRLRRFNPPRFSTVLIGCFLIVAVKNGLNGVFYPLLYNEDGRNIFAIFYNQHEFKNIFISYAGYIRVVPNLIGYLLNFLPVRLIPPLYCLISLFITALAYSLFYEVLNRIIDNRWFACYSAFMIAALPLGNFEIVETLMYQIWNCNLILFLMVLLPVPVKPWRRLGFVLATHLLIWTHPYSMIVLPLFIWNMVSRKENRWEQASFVISAICYFLTAVNAHTLNLTALKYFIPNILNRVVVETLIGPNNRVHLQYLGGINALDFAILFSMGAIFIFAWKNWSREHKLLIFICLYYSLVPLVAAFIGRDLGDYFHLLRGSPRYVYLPKIFFTLLVLLAAYELFKKSSTFRKWHWVLTPLILLINVNSNVLYKTKIEVGKDTLAFTHQLKRNTVSCKPGDEKFIYFNRGMWTFNANICKH